MLSWPYQEVPPRGLCAGSVSYQPHMPWKPIVFLEEVPLKLRGAGDDFGWHARVPEMPGEHAALLGELEESERTVSFRGFRKQSGI